MGSNTFLIGLSQGNSNVTYTIGQLNVSSDYFNQCTNLCHILQKSLMQPYSGDFDQIFLSRMNLSFGAREMSLKLLASYIFSSILDKK